MTPEQIKRAYTHVTEMLDNGDPYHPGVRRKHEQVRRVWNCANAELFLRYVLYSCNNTNLKTNKDVLDYITACKKLDNISNFDSVEAIFDGLLDTYKKVTIDDLLSACLDSLPAFNRKLISDKFIYSLGIWLTESEKKDLTEYDPNGKIRNRKDVIKERLFINPSIELQFNSRGLTYNEFRSLVRLEGRPKFSTMTTDVLILLRDKVLLLLDQDLEYHIQKWESLKGKLEAVAAQKNINLS